MSKKSYDVDNSLFVIEKFAENFDILEKNLKNHESNVDNELTKQNNNIHEINKDLKKFKEILDKTNEYLLLELESSLDKHAQIQIKNEVKYDEIIALIKDDEANKISSLSEELGRTKQILEEKNDLITILSSENSGFKSKIESLSSENSGFKSKIESLNNEITRIISENNIHTSQLKEETEKQIADLTNKKNELNDSLNETKNQNNLLIDENNYIKKSISEKEKQIEYLKEEIKILNSIINEKDETIDSLGGR